LTSYYELSSLLFCLRIGIESWLVSFLLVLAIALSVGIIVGLGFLEMEVVIAAIGEKENAQISLFLICIVGPVIETIIFQFAPIEFLRGMVGPRTQIIMSAAAFAAAHFLGGPIKGVAAGVVGGLYFGFTYVFWRKKSFEKAFILTIISHSISNFVSALGIAYVHGIESIGW
jgi:membrane protease YdiL (CAAX protease family)